MERRLKNYIEFLKSNNLDNFSSEDIERMQHECLIQLGFFQHERFIHLIVTITFALLTLLSIIAELVSGSMAFIILTGLLIVLLIPYVRHYYILENGVQTIYAYYDRMAAAASGNLRIVPKELYFKKKDE